MPSVRLRDNPSIQGDSGPKGGKAKLVCLRAKPGAGCQYAALDLASLETAIREGLPQLLDSAPSGDPAVDAAVDLLRHELENVEAGLSHLIDELQDRGRSSALPPP